VLLINESFNNFSFIELFAALDKFDEIFIDVLLEIKRSL